MTITPPAGWLSEFAQRSVTYRHSTRDRTAIYANVLPLFTSGRARILDNPRLIAQFASGSSGTRSPAGHERIDHGPGGHDDLCNAAAGALVKATSGSALVEGDHRNA